MHWIKENGWIIVGIFLTVNIIYIYFTDKYYYYNVENVRYTIAKYKHTGFIRNRIVYGFSYEVYGKTYNTNTEQILSNYNLEEDKLRIIVKYSEKWNEHSDINWKGAELDTAYMKKMNLEIP